MKLLPMLTASLLAFSTFTIADANAQGRASVTRQNHAGGVTRGVAHNNTGPNGGQTAGQRSLVTDGEGNGARTGTQCARGAQGEACRAGYTTRTADGAINHESGAAFQGVNGASGSTQGAFTRNADGTYAGERSTSASGEQGSYDATTTWNSENGASRSVTCTDPSGAVVACPSQ